MFVADWMTKKVVTISPDTSITEAARITKENKIRHLPIMKKDKLVGILSDRDIKEYVPSKATSLDVYELHYLLAKTKVEGIMTKKVITTTLDSPIEKAAMAMLENKIACLPVLENNQLVGIITDQDIFQVLVDITGIRHGGYRVSLTLEDVPGSIKGVADIIRKYGFRLQSVLTSYKKVKTGFRHIVIRMTSNGDFAGMKSALEKGYKGIKVIKG
jgi:acetoin utilization protein AcuB